MPSKPTILRAALVLPLLAVGLVSFILIRSQQGEGGTLIASQHQIQPLSASVNRVMLGAPDPNNPYGHARATAANCTPLGTGQLRNPWRCLIRYPRGLLIQYRVTINASGHYVADHEVILAPPPRLSSTAVISGCCVTVPSERAPRSP